MQFNIHINQSALVGLNKEYNEKSKKKIKLSLKHAAIFSFLHNFLPAKKVKKTVIENEIYSYVTYKKVIDELPLLDIKNKEVLGRYINDLVALGILKKHLFKNQYVYLARGDNYDVLFSTDEYVNPPTEKSNPLDSEVEAPPTEKSNNHNTSDHYTNIPTEQLKKKIKEMPQYELLIARTSNLTEEDINEYMTTVVYDLTKNNKVKKVDELVGVGFQKLNNYLKGHRAYKSQRKGKTRPKSDYAAQTVMETQTL